MIFKHFLLSLSLVITFSCNTRVQQWEHDNDAVQIYKLALDSTVVSDKIWRTYFLRMPFEDTTEKSARRRFDSILVRADTAILFIAVDPKRFVIKKEEK